MCCKLVANLLAIRGICSAHSEWFLCFPFYAAYITSGLSSKYKEKKYYYRTLLCHKKLHVTYPFFPSYLQPRSPLRSYTMEAIGPLSCTKDGIYIAGGAPSGNAYLWDVSSHSPVCPQGQKTTINPTFHWMNFFYGTFISAVVVH